MNHYPETSMHFLTCTLVLCACLLANAAQAQVVVKDPWVRATVPAQKATGAFMQLQAAADSKLVAASSPVAGIVEVHEMAMEHDVMRMRQIPFLTLPAGKTVQLSPGGYHIMLLELKRQAKEGDKLPLSLVIEGKDGRRKTIQTEAVVRGLTASAPSHGTRHGH
jgi:copper(I)-binding protein